MTLDKESPYMVAMVGSTRIYSSWWCKLPYVLSWQVWRFRWISQRSWTWPLAPLLRNRHGVMCNSCAHERCSANGSFVEQHCQIMQHRGKHLCHSTLLSTVPQGTRNGTVMLGASVMSQTFFHFKVTAAEQNMSEMLLTFQFLFGSSLLIKELIAHNVIRYGKAYALVSGLRCS